MKVALIIPFVFCCACAIAQSFSNASLQLLVDAERAFIRMAREKNTRDAFLYFLSDSAVTAAPGAGPRVGKQHLLKQAVSESYLHWEPTYSDIAASGDFGWNTGPWEFRQHRSDENPIAYGHFVSMWKKDQSGQWKVAIDIGIAHPRMEQQATLQTSAIPPPAKGSSRYPTVFDAEKAFLADYASRQNRAYIGVLSPEVRLYRQGHPPVISEGDALNFLKAEEEKVTYRLAGGDVSSSNDLAYVYGEVSVESVIDGTRQTKRGTYMRFWKKEDGIRWRIALDLISH